MEKQNPTKNVKLDKITVNFGAGKEPVQLKKGLKLLEMITGKKPVQTISKKRIPSWGLRIGLPIGCKVTLRGKEAEELLKKLIIAKEHKLTESQFKDGSVSFGIHEYVDVPGTKYDPEIGIIGFEVCINLKRPGYRVAIRQLKNSRIGHNHRLTKEDTIKFMIEKFNVKLGETE